MKFNVLYRPFPGADLKLVEVTVQPSPGKVGLYYATAPGAGCSKDYKTPRLAAYELVNADLGEVRTVTEA